MHGQISASSPKDNEKDLAEVPENLRGAMKLHFVDTMDQVLQIALESPLPKMAEEISEPIAPPLTTGNNDAPTVHQ